MQQVLRVGMRAEMYVNLSIRLRRGVCIVNHHALAPMRRYTDAIKEMMRQRAAMAVEAGRRKHADIDIMWKPNETQIRVLKVGRWAEAVRVRETFHLVLVLAFSGRDIGGSVVSIFRRSTAGAVGGSSWPARCVWPRLVGAFRLHGTPAPVPPPFLCPYTAWYSCHKSTLGPAFNPSSTRPATRLAARRATSSSST